MKFILNKQIKYYTKELIKWIYLIAIALLIIMTMVFLKYKVVCKVSFAGEEIGYVASKEKLENQINEIINNKEENIAYVDIEVLPQYEITLLSKNAEINEEEVLAKVEEVTKITYKFYAITLDGKEKTIVNSLEEAEKLVANMKEEYEESVNFTIGIHVIYTEDLNEYKTVSIEVAEADVLEELEEIKDASVNGVYLAQTPVSGVITSRFGNWESIRSHSHTGIDIAAPYGTNIKAASKGTVKWSGYMGSYGNLVIIDCGNGVEMYYGHCSKLLVSEGEKVEAGDIIGKVGSTGNSTGNHLHFEIRVNGTRVNPQNYIYK